MIEAAVQIALNNNSKRKFGCVITNKKGHIISRSENSYQKTHPIQYHYAKKTGNPHKIYLHAELRGLLQCREQPHTLYVARTLKDGSNAFSRPCPSCLAAIIDAGVEKVVYFNEEGEVEEMDIN